MKKFICISLLLAAVGSARAYVHANIRYSVCSTVLIQRVKHPETAMTEQQLDRILNRMRHQRNDAAKKQVLKTSLAGKGITIYQLTQCLNQFLNDDAKLNCALYAYRYTVDYKRYRKIEDLFAEQKSKDALEDFLSHRTD